MPHQLINLSQYTAQYLEWEIKGRDFLVVIAKVSLDLKHNCQAIPSDEQAPLQAVDEPNTENDLTSVRYEADFVPYKSRADILCAGQAFAPGGKQVTHCDVQFSVGDMNKTIRVVGDRHFTLNSDNRLQLTKAIPFTSMPLIYENAFGGVDPADEDGYRFYKFNPVGKAYSSDLTKLHGKAFPNLEDPERPIKKLNAKHQPVGFGPICYAWQPRLKLAGTYDDEWLENISPELPGDFDSAYYNCAPSDQQLEGYLKGDEIIQTLNMHADHPEFKTRLPGITIRAFIASTVDKQVNIENIKMKLDTCWVDMDDLKCVLVWRGVKACRGLTGDEAILIADEKLENRRPDNAFYADQFAAKMKEQQDVYDETGESEVIETGS